VGDPLRALWDFDDLDVSEARFRAQLELESSGDGQAEVLTQLARVEGLRGRFDEGEALLQQAEARAQTSAAALARIQMERGRLRRSSGDEEAARPLFEAAFARADAAGEEFLAVDAAHMAALVAPDRAGMLWWTQRGVEIAEESEDAGVNYWLGTLFNNLGWEYYEAGEYKEALEAFQRAFEARQRPPAQRSQLEVARYALGKALRALGRADEAVPLPEQAVSWAESHGKPDGWFHEELAEDYAALGRDAEAREHAKVALSLLPERDADRVARLRELAR
jgi:tetratricopeptide (TPR) repeat protein